MLRKIAEIKVPKGAGPREAKTNPIFATYDRQGAAFAFFFSDSNIAGAAANLLFMVDGKKVFVDDGVTLGETNETHTFTYPLPDKLLNYTGKVDGYLYFDFEDGSHSDEIHFVFTIKKSQIDEEMEDAPDVYIKSFEEIKADVQSTADKATSDIKSRVDAVENAKNSTVGDIEKVKDNAESQIGDYTGEVESAKDSTIEDIDKALPEVEGKLQDLQKEMIVGGRNYIRNSNMWASKNVESIEIMEDKLTAGTYVFSVDIEIENADKEGTEGKLGVEFGLYLEDGSHTYLGCWYYPEQGESFKGRISSTVEIPGKPKSIDYEYLYADLVNGDVVRAGLPKLGWGNVPTDWSPAPEDIVTKSELEKIKQAIINLGGSI